MDESNLQRQVLFNEGTVGMSKAIQAAERIKDLNSQISINVHQVKLDSSNAMSILTGYDLVLDGSDNLPTRYLVNDACVFLGKPLIYGAIFQYEGQVSVFNQLLKDEVRGPNYRDLFPEPPPPEMVPSCSEGGVLGVLPGIIGSMMANEAIKILVGIGTTLSGRLLLFDSLDFTTRIVNVKKSSTNPVSGESPTITSLIDYEQFCNPTKHQVIKEISPLELKAWMNSKKEFQLIDVRERKEIELVSIGGINVPVKSVESNLINIRKDIPVLVYCKSGGRSSLVVKKLQNMGYENATNLSGGILKWIDDVDSSLSRY